MVSGIIGISVLTVGLNSMFIQIKDKEKARLMIIKQVQVKLIYVNIIIFSFRIYINIYDLFNIFNFRINIFNNNQRVVIFSFWTVLGINWYSNTIYTVWCHYLDGYHFIF